MTRTEIASEVRRLIGEHYRASGKEPPEIGDDFQLVGRDDFDSLDFIEVTVGLEDRFEVEISDDAAERMKTFADVVEFLGQVLGAEAVGV